MAPRGPTRPTLRAMPTAAAPCGAASAARRVRRRRRPPARRRRRCLHRRRRQRHRRAPPPTPPSTKVVTAAGVYLVDGDQPFAVSRGPPSAGRWTNHPLKIYGQTAGCEPTWTAVDPSQSQGSTYYKGAGHCICQPCPLSLNASTTGRCRWRPAASRYAAVAAAAVGAAIVAAIVAAVAAAPAAAHHLQQRLPQLRLPRLLLLVRAPLWRRVAIPERRQLRRRRA